MTTHELEVTQIKERWTPLCRPKTVLGWQRSEGNNVPEKGKVTSVAPSGEINSIGQKTTVMVVLDHEERVGEWLGIGYKMIK